MIDVQRQIAARPSPAEQDSKTARAEVVAHEPEPRPCRHGDPEDEHGRRNEPDRREPCRGGSAQQCCDRGGAHRADRDQRRAGAHDCPLAAQRAREQADAKCSAGAGGGDRVDEGADAVPDARGGADPAAERAECAAPAEGRGNEHADMQQAGEDDRGRVRGLEPEQGVFASPASGNAAPTTAAKSRRRVIGLRRSRPMFTASPRAMELP